MTAPGPTPNPNDRLEQDIAALQAQINELARRTLYSATVSGGTLAVQDDGAFEVITSDGSYALYARRGVDGLREFGLLRDNGTYVLRTVPTGGGGQAWALHDNGNDIVVSDDAVSGQGLARPSMVWSTRRIRFDALPATDSAAFDTVADTAWVYKTHPRAYVQIVHCATTSGTTGEVRLMLDGVQVGGTMSAAFALTFTDIGPFAIPGSHMSQHRLELQCRRTGGTGRIGADMVIRSEQS